MTQDEKSPNESSMGDRDMLEVHRAALREPPDPGEGHEPGPWWLWAGVIIAIFVGGYYLGRFGGAFFKNAIHIGYLEPDKYAEVSPSKIEPKGAPTKEGIGATIYAGRCVSCHQSTGQGVPATFPPLAQSEWVTGDPETVVRVILHGLSGAVTVKGQTYNGVMPAWKDTMTPKEISEVATFIRTSWGNQAAAVDEGLVRRIIQETGTRTTPWTATELEKLRK